MPNRRKAQDSPAGLEVAISLDRIANCLAYLSLQTGDLKGKTNNELIPVLASWGFDKNAIASILQTTPETVRVRLAQLRAGKEKNSLT